MHQPSYMPPTPVQTTFSTSSTSFEGRRTIRTKELQFTLKYGHRHHSYDSEKAPYPLSYDKHGLEMEALDNKLTQYIRGSSSFVKFDTPPCRVLDLGCGTGTWIIDAAKQWPDSEFVGFDLVNVQIPLKLLDPSVASRIKWKHGNFLTTKLPFDDDEFDHVHIRSIAKGVPENKWGVLFEEINRVLNPGGTIEIIEDDVLFPVLPKWFTGALRAKSRQHNTSRSRDGNSVQSGNTPSHDHGLLESLLKGVFEHRFINTTPTAVLPSYFTTYFRQVTVSPVVTFPMPLLAPLLPQPSQVVTSYVLEPVSNSLEKRYSTVSPSTPSAGRPMSFSFSSGSTRSALSTFSSPGSVSNRRPRTASASLSSPWRSSAASSVATTPTTPSTADTPWPSAPFKPYIIETSEKGELHSFQGSLFPLDQLDLMSERSLAMHLYRSCQTVLSCQEAMWEELKDRIRNRKEELVAFGWEDDDELEELQNRKRFEKLIERFKSDIHIRISLWTSLTAFDWPIPSREPLSKAELIEEERIRESMLKASQTVTSEEIQTPCRSTKNWWTTVEPRMAVSASTRENQAHAQKNLQWTRSKLRKVEMVNKGKARETQVAGTVAFADSTWDRDSDNTNWRWTYLNDFTSSKAAPMFSKDGSYFFSFAGSLVRILSVSSGQVVSELTVSDEKCSGRQPIRFTSAIINPDNAFQLITSTLEGRIIIWDFLNAIILREIDVGKPIHCICAHKNLKDSIFVAASLNKKKTQENDAIVLRISLNHGPSGKSSAEVRAVGKTRSPSGIALSPSGEWLVATGGHTVYVSRTSALEAGFIKYVAPDRLTTLAMHPSEDYFATGDEKGSIRVWYCLNDGAVKSRGVEKKAQTTSLHWHAHAVASLSFTPNGAYLLSGGEEAVLVIWQLHTGKKEFVPRVGSAIVTISVFQGPLSEEYLLGLQDGTFCFISPSSLRITRSFSRLKIGLDNVHSDSRTTHVPVAFHQLSSTLILPSSHQSSLQLYSPYSSSLFGELEVSPSNRVSRRDDKPIDSAKVRLVALASSGLWMSTVDVREEEAGYQPEIFLKIWSWDLKANRWQLHSRIDQPHGSKYPVQLDFSPHNLDGTPLYLSSCGEDGIVKIWKLRAKAKEESWLPHATLSFPRTYVKNLTWSPDGTIFAVGLVNTVVLHDTTFTVIDSLTTFEHNSTTSVHFVGNRYLLVVGQKSLTSWDLISRSAWSYIPSRLIAFTVPHPQEGSFAVFLHPKDQETSVQTKAFVFDVESPRPRAEHTLPFKLRNITSTGSLQGSKAYNLIGLTDTSSVVLIDHDFSKSPVPRAPTLSFQFGRATIFQDMFGGTEFGGSIEGPSTQLVRQPADPRLGELFAQPTHLMAPISSLFDPLITSLIQPSAVPTDAAQSLSDDEDLEDEVMEDIVMTSSTAEPTLVPSVDPAILQPFVNFFRKSCQMAHASPSKILENGKSKKGCSNGMPITPTPTKLSFSPSSHRQSIA